MQKLSKANVVIINGLGMESFLEKPLAAAGKKIAVIDSSKGINAIVEEHGCSGGAQPLAAAASCPGSA